jgi:hypothetical protein
MAFVSLRLFGGISSFKMPFDIAYTRLDRLVIKSKFCSTNTIVISPFFDNLD